MQKKQLAKSHISIRAPSQSVKNIKEIADIEGVTRNNLIVTVLDYFSDRYFKEKEKGVQCSDLQRKSR